MKFGKGHYVLLRNGKFDGTSRAELDDGLAEYQADATRDTIVVHFHGGLVPEDSGLAIARRLYGEYALPNAWPIFFIWRSGFVETLKDNLGSIANQILFRVLVDRILETFAARLLPAKPKAMGLRAAAPMALVASHMKGLGRGIEPFGDVDPRSLVGARGATKAQADLLREAVSNDPRVARRGPRTMGLIGLPSPISLVKGAVKILYRVGKRFATGRDHGVYPTVVEEILRELYLADLGGAIWDAMKGDTADAFGKGANAYGGTALLEGLGRLASAKRLRRILIIAHSAGAVFACNLLKAADASLPADLRFDVALLAPACTFGLFAETLASYGSRIAEMRMFTMGDKAESDDSLVPGVYTRSLLYFISGTLEEDPDKPLLGLERCYQRPAYARLPGVARVRKHMSSSNPVRAVWSPSRDGLGASSTAEQHGAFDDDRTTLDSLRHIIGAGF